MTKEIAWVATCTIDEFEEAFPSWAWLTEDEADAEWQAVTPMLRGQLFQMQELSVMERALVAAWSDERERRRTIAQYIENIFLMDDSGEIPKKSKLSVTVAQMEQLVEAYGDVPSGLEMLVRKLDKLREHIKRLTDCTEKLEEDCAECAAYYRALLERCHKLDEGITDYRILQAEVPGRPKVHPETLRMLHDSSIFELYELQQAGEPKKKLRELQTAAQLECDWRQWPSVDLCDKWMLLGARAADNHKGTLEAFRYVVDEKTMRLQTLANTLREEASRMKKQLAGLEDRGKDLLDPRMKPSRFWRALVALVLCAGIAVASWRQPQWLMTALGDGYQLFYIVFGLAFAAGLLAKGILYSLWLCFCAGFGIFNTVTVVSIFMSGEPTLEETVFLTLGVGMAMCTLVLLWRTWSSRKALGGSKGQRAALLEDLKKLERRAALAAACVSQLEKAAKDQEAGDVAERYRQLETKFRTVRDTAKKYL